MSRARLRDLGIAIGSLPTGTYNAISDVPGVRVGHHTLRFDDPFPACTGVTVIEPREERSIWRDYAFAGFHSLNGCGEMTGMHWVEESGMLSTPIAVTNTFDVGTAQHALAKWGQEREHLPSFSLPVAAETHDGWLNDPRAKVTEEMVWSALEGAAGGTVAEGCVGGGTGMTCHELKSGIGTSSRVVETSVGAFVLGALVQSNYGKREHLRVDGVPVGREIGFDKVPSSRASPPVDGSIIVVIATDAPLLPDQCRRLARRAALGIARTGGAGLNGSGDLFLAFATGNHCPTGPSGVYSVRVLAQEEMNGLFVAVIDAVEESILNSLTMAETTRGRLGRVAHEIPLDALREAMARYGRAPRPPEP